MKLLPTLRYAHSEPYIRRALAEAALTMVSVVDVAVRNEKGVPVDSLVVVARASTWHTCSLGPANDRARALRGAARRSLRTGSPAAAGFRARTSSSFWPRRTSVLLIAPTGGGKTLAGFLRSFRGN